MGTDWKVMQCLIAALAAGLAASSLGCGGRLINVPVTVLDEPTVLEQAALGERGTEGPEAALLPLGEPSATSTERQQISSLCDALEQEWRDLASARAQDARTRMLQAIALHNSAVLKWRIGERQEAERLLGQALEHCTAYGLETVRWQVMQTLGDVRGGQEGLALYEQAARVLEDAPQLSEFEAALETPGRRSELYARLVDASMLQEDPESALDYALRRRAVELARAGSRRLLASPEGSAAELAARLGVARRRAAVVRADICAVPIEILTAAEGEQGAATVAVRDRWNQALEDIEATRNALRNASFDGGLIVPAPADILAVRDTLYPDTALLILEPAGQAHYAAFLIGAEAFEARMVEVPDNVVSSAGEAQTAAGRAALATLAEAVLGPFAELLTDPVQRLYVVCPDAFAGVDWEALPLRGSTLGQQLETAFAGDPADLAAAFAAKSFGRQRLLIVRDWPGTPPDVGAGMADDPQVTIVGARALDAAALLRYTSDADILWISNRVVLDSADPAASYLSTDAGRGRLGGVDVAALSRLGSHASCAALARLGPAPWQPAQQIALRLVCRGLASGGIASVVAASEDVPPDVALLFWNAYLEAARQGPAGAAFRRALSAVPQQWRNGFRLYGYLGMNEPEFADYVMREYAEQEQKAVLCLKDNRIEDAANALSDLLPMVPVLTRDAPEERFQRTTEVQRWLVNCWDRLARYDRAAMHERDLIEHLAANQGYPRRAIGFEYLSLGAILTKAERYEEAAGAFQEALSLLKEHGAPQDVAEALAELGKSYDRATRYELAMDSFERAMQEYRALDDETGVARQLQRIGALYLKRLDNPYSAEEYFRQARDLYEQSGAQAEAIEVRMDLALCRRMQGDLQGAIDALEDELGAAHTARLRGGEAFEEGEDALREAETALDEARRAHSAARLALDTALAAGLDEEAIRRAAAFESERQDALSAGQAQVDALKEEMGSLGNRFAFLQEQEARALSEIGNTLWLEGKYLEAHQHAHRSSEAVQELKQQVALRLGGGEASADYAFLSSMDIQGLRATEKLLDFQLNVNDQLLALIYWELNDFERAHAALDSAIQEASRAEVPLEVASAHNNRGIILRRQERYEEALDSFGKALAIDEQLQSRWGEGYDQRNIGITLHRMGRLGEAGQHLEAAVRLSGEIGDAVNHTRALYALGDLRLSQDQLDGAQQLFTEALEASRAIYLPEVEWRALRGLALVQERRGQSTRAIEMLVEAVEVVENLRGALKVEEFRSGFLTNKMDLYEDLVRLLIDAGRVEDALSYAERSRSRNFIDILAEQDFELKSDREKQLYEQQRSLARRLQSMTAAVRQEKDPAAREDLSRQLEALRTEYADLLVEIRAANPQLFSFVSVDVASLKDLSAALDRGVSLLVYYVMKDEVAIWVVRDGNLTLRRVKADRDQLTEQVRDYRLMVQRRESLDRVRAASQQLEGLLIAPVQDLISGSPAVGIVPHRCLHYLSFASLHDGEAFLVERYPLFYSPSASVLARVLRRDTPVGPEDADGRRALRVLAVGNPATGDPAYALPFSEKEVQSLARDFVDVTLLVGEKATEQWVRDHIGDFDVIHLATHGYFDSVNPLFSALVLTPDAAGGDDGLLELHEVSGLRVNARLVTLSACQSALGELQSGDELVSMSRAFMYAGTGSIMSTLWRVDDVATALLAKHFYRDYAGRSIELFATQDATLPGKAASLRRAQLRVMNDGRHYHPVYWAGMVLTGDYR